MTNVGNTRTYFWVDSHHIIECSWSIDRGLIVKQCEDGGGCRADKALTSLLSPPNALDVVQSLTADSPSQNILYSNGIQWEVTNLTTRKTSSLNEIGQYPGGLWDWRGTHAITLSEADQGTTSVSSFDPTGRKVSASISSFMSGYYEYIGGLPNGWIMGVTPDIGDGSVTGVLADPSATPQSRIIWFIPTPRDAYGPVSAKISPDGTRIAWLFRETPPPLGITAFNQSRLMRSVPQNVSSVWISDTEGNQLREAYREFTNTPFEDVEWTPDGRSVSFIKENAVWRLPVN